LPYLSGDDVTFTLLVWCSRVASVYRHDCKMGKVKGMCAHLTLYPLATTIVAPPRNASKWQVGFNLAFKGLMAAAASVARA
jgi:hypothetical protein